MLKVIGYDLEFERLVDKQIIDNQLTYISKSETEKKVVPNFLIDKSLDTEKLSTLLDGLKLVGDYLEKTILKLSFQKLMILNFSSAISEIMMVVIK